MEIVSGFSRKSVCTDWRDHPSLALSHPHPLSLDTFLGLYMTQRLLSERCTTHIGLTIITFVAGSMKINQRFILCLFRARWWQFVAGQACSHHYCSGGTRKKKKKQPKKQAFSERECLHCMHSQALIEVLGSIPVSTANQTEWHH